MTHSMDLPKGDVPELPPKRIAADAFVNWVEQNRRILIDNNLLQRFEDSRTTPCGERFSLCPAAPCSCGKLGNF